MVALLVAVEMKRPYLLSGPEAKRLSEFMCNLHSAGGKTFGEEKLKVG